MVVGDYLQSRAGGESNAGARTNVAHAWRSPPPSKLEDGTLLLALAGRMPGYPEQLSLTLAHPPAQAWIRLWPCITKGRPLSRSTAAMPNGKWHVLLVDGASTWRLSGVVHTPLNHPVTLSTSASTVQHPKGD